MQSWQSQFARALLDLDAAIPGGMSACNGHQPKERFAVYRNNVMAGLIGALEARFPAVKKIVGEDFFRAAARLFAAAHPPRSPLMMLYGDEFPAFLASFEPARDLPYLGDVALLEAARARAYHAASVEPLPPGALAASAPDALAQMRFVLHPSLEIVASPYPIVTIWAMNSGGIELSPITDWCAEDALVVRPRSDVEVRRLPPGARVFLQSIANGNALGEAARAALMADACFDLAANLAAVFSGLATRIHDGRLERGLS
jgi:hypothetical protein